MYIAYTKNKLTYVEVCNIDVTVGNGQKMKCELKVTVNIKLKGGEKVNLDNILYVNQDVKNLLSVSRLVTKVCNMGDTQDKTNIKKNGINMNLNTRKEKIGA